MGKRQNKAKRFHVLWEEVNKNLADYVTKHHPIWSQIKMRPKYVIATQKAVENSKDRQTGTRRGCARTANPRGTQKPDNPLN